MNPKLLPEDKLHLGLDARLNLAALSTTQRWQAASKHDIRIHAEQGDDSWEALRAMVVEPGRCGEAGGGVEGLLPVMWLRLVELTWELNELLVLSGDGMAAALRPGLAHARLETHMTAIKSLGSDVTARAFSSLRGDPEDDGQSMPEERQAYYLRVASARAVWFDYLCGRVADSAPVPVTDSRIRELLLKGDPGQEVRRDLSELLQSEGGGSSAATGGGALVDELATVQSMGRRLLLPRFMMDEMHRLGGGRWPWRCVAPVGAVAAGALAMLWAARCWSSTPGQWKNFLPAAVVLLVAGVAFTTHVFGSGNEPAMRRLDAWCLKIPAVTVIGAAATLALPAEWMRAPAALPKLSAAVACLLAVFAYMVVEAAVVSTGTKWQEILARVGAIWVVAVGYAAVVTAVVLGSVGTVFLAGDTCAGGSDLCPIPPRGLAERGPLFALLSSASLAIGVFLQSLWESEPITYPIAHLPRRGDIT